MDCRESLLYLAEALEGALDEDRASLLQAHLAICPGCGEEFHRQKEIKTLIQERATRHRAPAELRARVELLFEEGSRGKGWFRKGLSFFQAHPLITAFSALLILVIGFIFNRFPDTSPPLLAEAVNQHIRVLLRMEQDRPQTVHPSQLFPLFRGKLDFKLTLLPGIAEGFELVGGELTYFLDRKVACLIYRKGPSNLTTLFILPSNGMKVSGKKLLEVEGQRFLIFRHKGFNVLVWSREDLLYSMVSNLNEGDLAKLANRMMAI